MKKILFAFLFIFPFVLFAQITPTTGMENTVINTLEFQTVGWDSNPNYSVCFYKGGTYWVACNSATNVSGALGVEEFKTWWLGGTDVTSGTYKALLLDSSVGDWGTIYNYNYNEAKLADGFVEDNNNKINIVPYDISGGFLLYISDVLQENLILILTILGALIGLGFVIRFVKRQIGGEDMRQTEANYMDGSYKENREKNGY